MATLAIGDVQGCREELERLLERAAFDPACDRLWLVGDLVNRGPDSAGVLRLVRALGDAAVAVLGNHDLHLLAMSCAARAPQRRDTAQAVLDEPDGADLVAWLRARPLLHREGDRALVHAALAPAWTLDRAEGLAREAETVLRSGDMAHLLGHLIADAPCRWDDGLSGMARAAAIVTFLTKVRCLDAGGRADLEFAGPPDEAPSGLVPWFDVPGRQSAGSLVVFGHWAALGLLVRDDVIALDSGCVWGRELTAVRLEDRAVFQIPRKGSDPFS
jgi:bis(5'-nucleosyl)-tetraphosphatase (symmetrical)